jgi:hypothetical protein
VLNFLNYGSSFLGGYAWATITFATGLILEKSKISSASIIVLTFFTGLTSSSSFLISSDTSAFLSNLSSLIINGSGLSKIYSFFDSIPKLFSAFIFISDLYFVKAGFL